MPEAPWIPASPSAVTAVLPPTPVGIAATSVNAAAVLPPTPVIAGVGVKAAAKKWQIDPAVTVRPFIGWGVRLASS